MSTGLTPACQRSAKALAEIPIYATNFSPAESIFAVTTEQAMLTKRPAAAAAGEALFGGPLAYCGRSIAAAVLPLPRTASAAPRVIAGDHGHEV